MEKEKAKRLLHKMNVSRKSKIMIIMLLVTALLACIINIVDMGYSLANHGEMLDTERMIRNSVIMLWFAFLAVLFITKQRKSGLFAEMEDIYNSNIDPVGKTILMKKAVKEYRYEEEISEIEQKVYECSCIRCSDENAEQEKMMTLRAEISSDNTQETLFSLFTVVFEIIVNNTAPNGAVAVWISAAMVLVLCLWIACYLENMKRNRFILTALS